MPLHLPAVGRREFLRHSTAFAATLTLGRSAMGDEDRVDAALFAMLNDTHVSENVDRAPNGQNISANLTHVVDYLLALPKRPAGVFINGDCAHNVGLPGDYRQLAKLIRPLRDAGIDVHLTLGNHDDRTVFLDVLAEHRKTDAPVAAKFVSVVEADAATFFLLDSLGQTNVAAGELGEQQLSWLIRELDRRRDRPAIIVAHHNPQFAPNGPESKFVWSGLSDSTVLFDALAERRQVKAYMHGHIHRWGLSRRDDLHVVNTPAIGYVAKDGETTTGWTMLRLRDDGMELTTYTINGNHPWHGRSHELRWGAG